MSAEIVTWDGSPVTEPGLYRMPEADYHADPVKEGSLSSTMARQILKSPANLRHYLDSPRVEKKEFDFGHAVHAGVLGVGMEVVAIPEHVLSESGSIGTKAAKAFIADAYLDGKVPLKQKEFEPVQACVAAVKSHALASELFAAGEPEISAFAIDPNTGLWLRARFDWVTPAGVLVDLKTARDGEPFKFERHALGFGYETQDAFYQYVWRLVTGGYPEGFQFVTVETAPPHLVDVHQGDIAWEQHGQIRIRAAIDTYKHCLDTGEWPGRPAEVNALSIPNYLIEEDEEVKV